MRPTHLLPRLVVTALAVLAAAACSSKQGSGPTDNGGIDGTPQGTNPNGVAYPSQHIGHGARGLDPSGAPSTATRGDVIANYKFLGYPNSDSSKGLQSVSLSDFFDPTGAKYKLIHIVAAAEWCNPCIQETDALVTALKSPATNYASQGVVYLQAVVEGYSPNVGSTTADLNDWIKKHNPTFTEVLDPEAHILGEFFNAAAVPFNADVDARSMEILQAGVGYEDPSAVQVWLDWIAANPATKY